MKKVFQKLMFVAAIGTVGFLYSCGEDEETLPAAPTVTASADANEYEVGETAVVTVQFTAPGELSGINITPEFDGQTGTTDFNSPSDFGLTDTETAGTVTINFAIDETLADLTVKLLIDVVDKNNQIATDSVEFTVATADPIARSYTAILLESPLGDFTGQNFFATNSGTKYSPDEVTSSTASISPNIDFGFYYGQSDLASIASPEGFKSTVFSAQVNGWNTTNDTNLGTTTIGASEFLEVSTWGDIDAIVDAATNDANNVVSGVAVGDVITFVRVDGVKGLILISDLIDGNNDGDFFDSVDGVEIDVLVQEEATN